MAQPLPRRYRGGTGRGFSLAAGRRSLFRFKRKPELIVRAPATWNGLKPFDKIGACQFAAIDIPRSENSIGQQLKMTVHKLHTESDKNKNARSCMTVHLSLKWSQ